MEDAEQVYRTACSHCHYSSSVSTYRHTLDYNEIFARPPLLELMPLFIFVSLYKGESCFVLSNS